MLGTVFTSTPATIHATTLTSPIDVSFAATQTAPTIPDPPQINVRAAVSSIAKEYHVSSTTMLNVALSEAQLDPDFPLESVAKHLKAGDAWKYWESLNCYKFVKDHIPSLPRMAEIQPNSRPKVGGVAIFWYTDKTTGEWEKHVAIETAVKGSHITIKEANFKAGVIGTRVIHTSDPHYVGTWSDVV